MHFKKFTGRLRYRKGGFALFVTYRVRVIPRVSLPPREPEPLPLMRKREAGERRREDEGCDGDGSRGNGTIPFEIRFIGGPMKTPPRISIYKV